MEPKLIKEEAIEKEVSSFGDSQAALRTRSKTGSSKDRCKTPDSPEGARLTQPPSSSPSQSSPVRPPTNGTTSPLQNGSTDSLTPPPVPLSAALSLAVATEHGAAVSTPLQHLPPGAQHHGYAVHGNSTGGAGGGYYAAGGGGIGVGRSMVKVKRFLGTLVQFGHDIGPEVGDRVRSLVLSLVSSSVSIEEFHHSLQDVTNFPLRPFVLPFLRAHLPPLQREIQALARAAKQSPLQYLRAHDHVILEPAHSPAEPSEIFLSTSVETPPAAAVAAAAATAAAVKRRASETLYENGVNGGAQHPSAVSNHETTEYGAPPTKRPYNFILSHQSLLLPNLGLSSQVPQTNFFDYGQHGHPYTTNTTPHRPDDVDSNNRPTSSNEEWRNIHVMLNCILSMVEKTKRALSILQQRNSQELTSEWLRKQDVSADLKKAAGDIMAQAVRQTEDRVAEVKRKAEEAVNDVKRQAVVELQKAVAAAEIKANELVANERAKMEKMVLESRKHSEEASSGLNHVDTGENSQSPPVAAQPAPSQQNSCWNCGRKAHETCSGCSVARYCGPFCQHKDWENHHQVCNSREKVRPQRSVTPGTPASVTVNVPVVASGQVAQDTARLKK